MKRITRLISAACLAAGCSDRPQLLEPVLYPDAVSQQVEMKTFPPHRGAELAEEAIAAIDDVLERVVPSLGNNDETRMLERRLSALRTGVTTENRDSVAALLAVAREAVERHFRAHGDDAELDVIRMALEVGAPADPPAPFHPRPEDSGAQGARQGTAKIADRG